MKGKYILYAICILIIVSVAFVFAKHTNGTMAKKKPSVVTAESTVSTKNTTPEKKNCHCCEDRLAKFKERLKKMREEKKAKEENP